MVPQHQDQAPGLNVYAARRVRLQQMLFEGARAPDAALITQIANVSYLTGFTGSSAWLVLLPDRAHLITSGIYATQIGMEVPDIPTTVYSPGEESGAILAGLLQSWGVRTLGIESSNSLQFVKGLRKHLRKARIAPMLLKGVVEKMRLVKDAYELAQIRAAVAIADAAFEHVQRMLQPGVAEWDIAMEIDFYIRRQGAYPAFETLVVSGERSALPHGKPTERKLERGDFVTLDFGARYQGYCSDLTRTVVVGYASQEHRRLYHAVLDALERSLGAIRPGKTGRAIDKVARRTLEKYGLADYFRHSLGHSLGINVHDGVGLAPREKTKLQPGMVLTVEPGVYLPGFGGVRIEEDVLVTETGCEVLSRSPRTLMVTGY
ncbi:Aminopeptidase YpdF [bacterium HR15]|nr:Aminopeptidase YpdF [bacterium HR15]